MAKGQAAIQQQNTQLAQQAAADARADRERMLQGAPEEQARRARISARRAATSKGDWDNAPDFVGNTASVAERFRKSQARDSLAPTGTAALGMAYANPNAVAQQQSYLKDAWDRDASGQFEGDVKDYMQDTDDMELGVIRDRNNIDNALLNNSTSSSIDRYNLAAQIAGRRGSWAPALLGGVGGAVGGLLSNPAI